MKTIFWNVDTQYDFMRDDESFRGQLPIPEARGREGNLAKLTKYAKENEYQVINTADWHALEDEEISGNPHPPETFPAHCLQYTKGAEFVPATNPVNPHIVEYNRGGLDYDLIKDSRNILIYKNKFDVFAGNPKTGQIVKMINPDRAVVYGVATNVCVDFAVKGLLERGVEVYVLIDAIKELPNVPLPYGDWKRAGIIFTKTNEIHKILGDKK